MIININLSEYNYLSRFRLPLSEAHFLMYKAQCKHFAFFALYSNVIQVIMIINFKKYGKKWSWLTELISCRTLCEF